MTIDWYGQSCFKIDAREGVIAIDPFAKDIGLTSPRFHADVLLVTHQHADHANTQAISARSTKADKIENKDKEGGTPLIIDGPGEYEAGGFSITGIATFHDSREGKERGPNTVFRIESEGVVAAHLGDFGENALREETLEALGNVDILMIPVGGVYTIDSEGAVKAANQIEPRIIIPMHYHIPGLKFKLAPVDDFLKSYGASKAERVDRLVVRKRDLPEDTQVVVLNAK